MSFGRGLAQPTALEGPCTAWTLGDLCCPCEATATAQEIQDAITNAIADVFTWTCRRFTNCCRLETRPCPPRCACYCGHCEDCGIYQRIDLWDAFCVDRITAVNAVTVEGATVPATDYRLEPDRGTRRPRYLVLNADLPNAARPYCWPPQDLRAPNGDPNTWSITVDTGATPPPDLLRATADLACEYLKLCKDPDSCNLHDGIRTLQRRGVTMEFDQLVDGNSGVPSLDRAMLKYSCQSYDFEGAWNPNAEWSYHPVIRSAVCS